MKNPNPKERPILFSGPMVRAIIKGRKTQTRRVVSLEHVLSPDHKRLGFEACDDPALFRYTTLCEGVPRLTIPTRHADDRQYDWEDCGGECLYCPLGYIGDRLWVRETFQQLGKKIVYRADGEQGITWKPSIFMPRAFSRLLLEIVGVRAERVQSISRRDAIAEGCPSHPADCCIPAQVCSAHQPPLAAFRVLWDSLNSKRGYGWDKNPWVWVIEFQVVETKP